MLPDPTERNVNPLLLQTAIRTVKKLVLTLAIHDKNVPMDKTARASFNVRTELALPFEGYRNSPKQRALHSHALQTAAHHRCATSAYPRCPSPIKFKVRSSWHISLSTPWVHQGCDSPPQSSKQWPTPPASSWPDSCALPTRI